MKRNGTKLAEIGRITLGDLVATVDELTHNKRLSAIVVADLINRRRVRIDGLFEGRRVVVA